MSKLKNRAAFDLLVIEEKKSKRALTKKKSGVILF